MLLGQPVVDSLRESLRVEYHREIGKQLGIVQGHPLRLGEVSERLVVIALDVGLPQRIPHLRALLTQRLVPVQVLILGGGEFDVVELARAADRRQPARLHKINRLLLVGLIPDQEELPQCLLDVILG